MNVGIYIYDGAEVLDFSGPFEVFSTASRVCLDDEPFNVFLVSHTEKVVVARAEYKVIPDYSFENCPDMDILIISGGVHDEPMEDKNIIEWIAKECKKVKQISSVCTGAFLLAKAKILTSHQVTTHHEDMQSLQTLFPSLSIIKNKRWVEEGNIITSGGISAGIDMSLYLVSKWHSLELAEKTSNKMEFTWTTK